MVLVDTSSWIEALRVNGDATVRERVGDLVTNGTAAWCHVVRLELWNGVRGDAERRDLQRLEPLVSLLPIDDDVWAMSIQLGRTARTQGLTAPAPDLIIAATARVHRVDVEHSDKHLRQLLSIR